MPINIKFYLFQGCKSKLKSFNHHIRNQKHNPMPYFTRLLAIQFWYVNGRKGVSLQMGIYFLTNCSL
jgi:hypothetical protein